MREGASSGRFLSCAGACSIDAGILSDVRPRPHRRRPESTVAVRPGSAIRSALNARILSTSSSDQWPAARSLATVPERSTLSIATAPPGRRSGTTSARWRGIVGLERVEEREVERPAQRCEPLRAVLEPQVGPVREPGPLEISPRRLVPAGVDLERDDPAALTERAGDVERRDADRRAHLDRRARAASARPAPRAGGRSRGRRSGCRRARRGRSSRPAPGRAPGRATADSPRRPSARITPARASLA